MTDRRGMLRQRGFTLLEMAVVVAIIGIIAGTAVPLFQSLMDLTRGKEEVAQVDRFIAGLKTYYLQQVERRRDLQASVQAGNVVAVPSNLLPDVSASPTPEAAAYDAAVQMVATSAIEGTQNPADIYTSASRSTRKIALYINQPDMSAANAGYAQFIANQAPTGITAANWGAAYCPHKAMAYNANVATPTVADRSLMAMALVISSGGNGVFDTFGGASTAPGQAAMPIDWRDPAFTIAGDDVGAVINFSALHVSDGSSEATSLKLAHLADAAGIYFRSKYQQDANAGVSLTTLIGTNYYAPLATPSGLRSTLSLPPASVVDGWGNAININQQKLTFPYTIVFYNECGDYTAAPATAP